ncbi:MAG TPA: hypothetical protein DEF43_16375, partial [Chloroflexus aurantiacus]|nr:hypothetical protein [Chloroflexus aurantiacus]
MRWQVCPIHQRATCYVASVYAAGVEPHGTPYRSLPPTPKTPRGNKNILNNTPLPSLLSPNLSPNLSPIPYPLSPIPYLLSPISYLLSPISY